MADVKVKLEGLEELKHVINVKSRQTQEVKHAVLMNGSQLQQKAQMKSPVDTGNLKRSIKLSVENGGMRAKVEAEAEYAPYVEYGTRLMNAQPYLTPSFNEQKVKFQNDIDKLMKKEA